MNLVEVATWIQEGYAKYYEELIANTLKGEKKQVIMRYVMNKGRGHLNPNIIEQLIDMEDSVEDLLNPGSKLC